MTVAAGRPIFCRLRSRSAPARRLSPCFPLSGGEREASRCEISKSSTRSTQCRLRRGSHESCATPNPCAARRRALVRGRRPRASGVFWRAHLPTDQILHAVSGCAALLQNRTNLVKRGCLRRSVQRGWRGGARARCVSECHAAIAEPGGFGHGVERRLQALHVESTIATVAQQHVGVIVRSVAHRAA